MIGAIKQAFGKRWFHILGPEGEDFRLGSHFGKSLSIIAPVSRGSQVTRVHFYIARDHT